MINAVYIQYGREEFERGRKVHERWETNKPINVPKAIRYVVGFNHKGNLPFEWEEFSDRFPLEERVKILNHSGPVGWREEYNDWVKRMSKTGKMDEEKGYFVYPSRVYKEEENIKRRLKPISLRYTTKDSGKLYKTGTWDIGKNTKTLIFYDDVLAAQIELENYMNDAVGPDAAPYTDLAVKFKNGQEIKRDWSALEGRTLECLERRIREKLGEDVNSFELHEDYYATLLRDN